MALTLRLAREKLDSEPSETRRLLDCSRRELEQALRELRELARGIHPAVSPIAVSAPPSRRSPSRAPLPVEVHTELPARRLPEQLELAAYFVVSEALTNVAKHASATKASVALTERDGRLADRGQRRRRRRRRPRPGTGLRGLADRVAALDGRLEIDSKPGQGTMVRATIPCP